MNAATITRVQPETIVLGNVEEFLTFYGTDLQHKESIVLTISGPAGEFTLVPNFVGFDRSGNEVMMSWVPDLILLAEGTHSVMVAIKAVGAPVQNFGPFTFSVQQVITHGPPLLDLPEDVTANATNSDGANVRYEVSATSENGASVPVQCDRESGSFFNFGTTVVTCTATDEFGTAGGEFTVFVGDFVPPVVTVPEDFSSDTPIVQYAASAVDNIDGAVPVTCSYPSGSAFPTGVVEVVCIAYDSHFNPGIGIFYVTVSGGVPVLALPGDIVTDATTATGAVVTYNVTASENGVVNCAPPSGSTFQIGTTAVLCSATNAAGTSTGSFNVTVMDNSGPVLDLPASITAEATSEQGAVVTFSATATDAVDGVRPVTCDRASGSTFPLGVTLVTCSATDLFGHETSGSFEVTVADTTAPQIINASVSPDTLWPPNHQMVPVTVTVVAADLVDMHPVAQIVSITSNQPANGTGDGDTSPDWILTGALNAELRSERAGSADRVYTITIQVMDSSGNFTTRELTVRVAQSSRRRSVR